MRQIGTLKIINRYPVKSMKGEQLTKVNVLQTGIEADRIFAFIDETNHSNFPWMTARQKHEMILFEPLELTQNPNGKFTIKIKTPEGKVFKIGDPLFIDYIGQRFGRPVKLKYSIKGNHDSKSISIFSFQTLSLLKDELRLNILNYQRFRANFYINWHDLQPFYENKLVGKVIQLGNYVQLEIVKKDHRCVIITLDPQTADSNMSILEYILKQHQGYAGVYAKVQRTGNVKIDDPVFLLD